MVEPAKSRVTRSSSNFSIQFTIYPTASITIIVILAVGSEIYCD